MKLFYVICCIVGAVAPYSKFVPWIIEHGVAPGAMFAEAASTRIGAFTWLDVLVSAVVLLIFVGVEGPAVGHAAALGASACYADCWRLARLTAISSFAATPS